MDQRGLDVPANTAAGEFHLFAGFVLRPINLFGALLARIIFIVTVLVGCSSPLAHLDQRLLG